MCSASRHGAKIMALYALRIAPKGLICNDTGRGLDDSGIEELGAGEAIPKIAEQNGSEAAIKSARGP
jgi:hypothetical protein